MRTGVSYFGNRTLRHVQADLEEIAAHEFDYVVHCFTESDLLWGLESMREIVRITRGLGMEAHLDPWGVAGVFGGEALSKFSTWETAANQVLADGSTVGVSCLHRPALMKFLHRWIDAGIDIGADVLFFDEPHWYPGDLWYVGEASGDQSGRWSCRCILCLELFQARFGHPMPVTLDDEVRVFRQDAVLALVTDLISHVKDRGVETALCLLPKGITFDLVGVPDWVPFGMIEDLDYFGTDPYQRAGGSVVSIEDYVRPNAIAVRELCQTHGLREQFWTQAFGFPAGTEHESADAIRVAVEEGMSDIAVWSYRSCESMSKLWSADNELTWQVTLEALAKAREQSR